MTQTKYLLAAMAGDDQQHSAGTPSAETAEKKEATAPQPRPAKAKRAPQPSRPKFGPGAPNIPRKPMIAWRGSGR